jgi:hypothetical protein
MKLTANRSFWYRNEKGGMSYPVKIGEEFDLDEKESRDQLLQILELGKAYVSDPVLFPEKVSCKVVANYSESQSGPGQRIFSLVKDHIVDLDRRMATKLLILGFVIREHPDEWSPRDLKSGKASTLGTARKMFDDGPDPVNFVTTRGERRHR